MKTNNSILVTVLTVLCACNQKTKNVELNPLNKVETINYLSINNQVQEVLQNNNGKFPIIIYDKAKGNKHLIYLGEQHGNDPADTRFDTIQKYFALFKPDVLLNEGGQIRDTVHFKSKNEAIEKKGTLGFLKYLADNANLKLVNADCPDSVEIRSLLKIYDKDLLLYFLVMQRFIPQFISGYNGATDSNVEYKKFTDNYLTKRCKLALSESERQWSYFEILFKRYNDNKSIDLKNFDLSLTEISSNEEGNLGKLGRSSLYIRDSVIITNIYQNLQLYNKVFIVFGAAHLLAEKPTLDKIFEK